MAQGHRDQPVQPAHRVHRPVPAPQPAGEGHREGVRPRRRLGGPGGGQGRREDRPHRVTAHSADALKILVEQYSDRLETVMFPYNIVEDQGRDVLALAREKGNGHHRHEAPGGGQPGRLRPGPAVHRRQRRVRRDDPRHGLPRGGGFATPPWIWKPPSPRRSWSSVPPSARSWAPSSAAGATTAPPAPTASTSPAASSWPTTPKSTAWPTGPGPATTPCPTTPAPASCAAPAKSAAPYGLPIRDMLMDVAKIFGR